MRGDECVVLVVEDDVEMNELEREFLAIHGFRTISAYTGTEAVDACCRDRPDAVLLDVMLPEMDGFETCRRLRSQRSSKLPIIMISALAEEESRQRGLASGADAYFSKPFDPSEVVKVLRELIEARIDG